MRIARYMFALLITIGLGLSPVASAVAQVNMPKCDHARTMIMGMDKIVDGQQAVVQATSQDDCDCCKDATKCPMSACATKCFGTQAFLAVETATQFLTRVRQGILPSTIPRSFSFPPEPPPPRV